MNAEQNVEFARELIKRGATDGLRSLLERYDELFTEDLRWTPRTQLVVHGRDYRGREGFARYVDDFEDGFSRLTYRDATFRAVGDDVVIARARIAVEGAASHVLVEQDIAWVFHFKGDRIDAAETHPDGAEAETAAEEMGRAQA